METGRVGDPPFVLKGVGTCENLGEGSRGLENEVVHWASAGRNHRLQSHFVQPSACGACGSLGMRCLRLSDR